MCDLKDKIAAFKPKACRPTKAGIVTLPLFFMVGDRIQLLCRSAPIPHGSAAANLGLTNGNLLL